MNTSKKDRAFDCVKMKNEIQAKIHTETKDMNINELLEYFNNSVVATRQPIVHGHLSFNNAIVRQTFAE
jgi:hypothetical protein